MVVSVTVVAVVYSENYLPESVKKEIEAAWPEEMGRPFENWFDVEKPSGVRYYGRHNGYYILLDDTGMRGMMITGIKIGNVTFEYRKGFSLLAYKNGEFIQLEDAYAEGLLTDEQIAQIEEKHKETEKYRAEYLSR